MGDGYGKTRDSDGKEHLHLVSSAVGRDADDGVRTGGEGAATGDGGDADDPRKRGPALPVQADEPDGPSDLARCVVCGEKRAPLLFRICFYCGEYVCDGCSDVDDSVDANVMCGACVRARGW